MKKLMSFVAFSTDPYNPTNLNKHQIEHEAIDPVGFDVVFLKDVANSKKSYWQTMLGENVYGYSLSLSVWDIETGTQTVFADGFHSAFAKEKKKTLVNPLAQKEAKKTYKKPSWCDQTIWDQAIASLKDDATSSATAPYIVETNNAENPSYF